MEESNVEIPTDKLSELYELASAECRGLEYPSWRLQRLERELREAWLRSTLEDARKIDAVSTEAAK
jgi:hypothetical protein